MRMKVMDGACAPLLRPAICQGMTEMLDIRFLPLVMLSTMLAGCGQYTAMSSEAKAAAPASVTASAANPVVVELFQSQGCSSCPPANAAVNAIADRSDIIALNFAVTYWDRLGWKDIFADKAYTQRQYDYARTLGDENVYTPQIILNGKRAIVGTKPGELSRAIAATSPLGNAPSITADTASVKIGSGSGGATVWLVRYDPRVQNVAVRSGENSGRVLPHKNIVRQLDKLGRWNGAAVNYALTKSGNTIWKPVILVQSDRGAILSAKRI
jgi:hypothetical protein